MELVATSVTPDLDRYLRATLLGMGDAQDTRPGLPINANKRGVRYTEEMTVYMEDGTLLGTMTLTHLLVAPVFGHKWLTPVLSKTDVTRPDLLRRHFPTLEP